MDIMKHRIPSLSLLLAIFWPAWSSAQCLPASPAFRSGEHLEYEVAYNWGVLWVNAGRAAFTVDSLGGGENGQYELDSYGESYRFYDWFYKVRDRFQGRVDAGSLTPVWFRRDTYEGGYAVNNTYTYDWDRGVVCSDTENTKRPRSVDTLFIEP